MKAEAVDRQRMRTNTGVLTLLVLVLASCVEAHAQFVQQGPKLVGTGAVGGLVLSGAGQGRSVAVSADGNTALVGGYADDTYVGAAWVFTRSAGVWTQQGGKLVGTGAVGRASQGSSVALSADGNTALVGGPGDNNSIGAVWVWARNGSAWTQQAKLVGSGAVPNGASGGPSQGLALALSADGNTAIVGGYQDNNLQGAAWVFIRSGGAWTQQGPKLVGTGAQAAGIYGSAQGYSVALSADGDTALVGGGYDNDYSGAAWVWTRSGGVWTQQGAKIVGTGISGATRQGYAAALSADGNTALVGGLGPVAGATTFGAVWAWTRSGGGWTQQDVVQAGTTSTDLISLTVAADGNTALFGVPGDDINNVGGGALVLTRRNARWTQQGDKLLGTGVVGSAAQGSSVALSGDGRTALTGGPADANFIGAAWVFVMSGPDDFDGDTKADILWRHTAGGVVLWQMDGGQAITGSVIGTVDPAWQIVATRDFNADGKVDILWRHATGATAMWLMNGALVVGGGGLSGVDPSWQPVAIGDYNGDRQADIIWRDSSGTMRMRMMSGTQVIRVGQLPTVDSAWQIVGSGDYNGDSRADLLWRHTSGDLVVWMMDGAQIIGGGGLGAIDPAWQIVGSGDYNGDGCADILWRHTSGATAVWLMNGTQIIGWDGLGVTDAAWQVVGSGDYNGDRRSDILWRHTSGANAIWFMNGTQVLAGAGLGVIDPAWQIVNTR